MFYSFGTEALKMAINSHLYHLPAPHLEAASTVTTTEASPASEAATVASKAPPASTICQTNKVFQQARPITTREAEDARKTVAVPPKLSAGLGVLHLLHSNRRAKFRLPQELRWGDSLLAF